MAAPHLTHLDRLLQLPTSQGYAMGGAAAALQGTGGDDAHFQWYGSAAGSQVGAGGLKGDGQMRGAQGLGKMGMPPSLASAHGNPSAHLTLMSTLNAGNAPSRSAGPQAHMQLTHMSSVPGHDSSNR